VQVVVDQPGQRGLPARLGVGVVRGSARVLAEQVVEAVPAGLGLLEQVRIDQVFQQPLGDLHLDVDQGCRGVLIQVRAGVQAQEPEQALLFGGEVLVGQGERGGHAAVSHCEFGQPAVPVA
jgi:hypothetical protein